MEEHSKENNTKILFDTNPDDTQIIYSDNEDVVDSMWALQDIVLISSIDDDVIMPNMSGRELIEVIKKNIRV